MRAVDELIEYIMNSARIPSRTRRRDIERELRCHIEDFVVAAREAGCGQDEIEKLVVANFGSRPDRAELCLGLPARTA